MFFSLQKWLLFFITWWPCGYCSHHWGLRLRVKYRLQKDNNFLRKTEWSWKYSCGQWRNAEIILASTLNSMPLLECSWRCSLEAKEREDCYSTGFKERLLKSETLPVTKKQRKKSKAKGADSVKALTEYLVSLHSLSSTVWFVFSFLFVSNSPVWKDDHSLYLFWSVIGHFVGKIKIKKQNWKGINLCTGKYVRPYLVKETELAYFKLVEKWIYDMPVCFSSSLWEEEGLAPDQEAIL